MSALRNAYTKLSLLYPKLREDDQIKLQEAMDDITMAMVLEIELEDTLRSQVSGHNLTTLVHNATTELRDMRSTCERLGNELEEATVVITHRIEED